MFKAKFKKTIAEAIYQEVTSKTALYYHWFGKENPWTDFLNQFIPSSNIDSPGAPSDNFRYDLHVRRDILTAKKIKPSDVSYVVRRIDWKPDTVYDMYDDAYDVTSGYGYGPAASGATRLEDANFYVLTTEYNVYKCIWNANDSVSVNMPTGTGYEIFTTADGYKWKFMYTIPPGLRNKFLSAEYMPVSNSLKAQYYTAGEILNIGIENGGANYNPATTTAQIVGDGYSEENPVNIVGVTIADGGDGYVSPPDIEVIGPFQFATLWVSGAQVITGTTIKYTNPATARTNYYKVVTGTVLGTSGPIHTSGLADNGTCQLKYVGTQALAASNIVGTAVDSIVFSEFGYGYQSEPDLIVSEPFVKDLSWTSGTAASLGNIVEANGLYYEVTVGGNLGLTAPNHTTGTATNGTTSLLYLGKIAEITVDVVKTEASITLDISSGTDTVSTVNMTNPGSKYVEVPLVTFTAPATGTTATGTAYILDGQVLGVSMVNPGNGYTSAPLVTFENAYITINGASSVDEAANTIAYTGHLFETGDEVLYTDGGGTSIGGLTTSTNYYVIRVDANSLQLAATLADANVGNEIDISDGVGANHRLTLTTNIATGEALLGTGGEIVGYTIVDPGIGYTNAEIIVTDTSGSGSGAILTANLDIGNVDTLQSTVELLAVPGSIETFKVVDGGTGYGAATVEILGDGFGATAVATCSGGKVVAVDIVNPGTGYTWTDVRITGNTGSSGAAVRAIMSPISGHGYDAIDELNANALVFYTALSRDKNQGIEINNDYRKVGLIRNLKQFGSNRRFTEDTGSGCVLITGEFDKTKLEYDMLILKDGYKKYRIVEFTDTQILVSVFNNFTVVPGDVLVTDPTNAGLNTNPTVPVSNILITAVSERTIDQFSGDFLMFSVRDPYSATNDQIVTVRTVIEL